MANEITKTPEVVSEIRQDSFNNQIDIGKRIDVNRPSVETKKDEVDIGKRVQPETKRDLSQTQKDELINKGMSPGIINDCSINDGKIVLDTQNSDMAGKKHPETGVEFVRKTVDLQGTKIEGVFAKFDSKFTASLPDSMLKASDKDQFNECNRQLKDAISDNPKLKEQFTERQLAQIDAGQKPGGCTWHHNEETGRMELVDTNIHSSTGHTGGRAIWGGGGAMRSGE